VVDEVVNDVDEDEDVVDIGTILVDADIKMLDELYIYLHFVYNKNIFTINR
jgi:hypothetical protein